MSSYRAINEKNQLENRTLGNMSLGFYKMSLNKGAPDVGALIFMPCPMDPFYGFPMDRSRRLCGMINGQEVEVWKIGERAAARISQAEYDYLVAVRAWDAQHDPDSPEAHPYRAVTTTPKAKPEKVSRPTVNIREIPLSNFMP